MNRFFRPASMFVAAALALVGLSTTTAEAEVDVYTTPGIHTVGGRQWNTTCEQYSSTIQRCRAEIWATQVMRTGDTYSQKTGWAFNNLTYKPISRAGWGTNPLAQPGLHKIGGREWRVECDTPNVGRNGCRAYIWGSINFYNGITYGTVQGWQFNNLIRFTDSPPAGIALYANWVNVDVDIQSLAQVNKISHLPEKFQRFIKAVYAEQSMGGSDCPEPLTVSVDAYHGAGYATGAVLSCGGYATHWGIRNGNWTELAGAQDALPCAVLDRFGFPRGNGESCTLPDYTLRTW